MTISAQTVTLENSLDRLTVKLPSNKTIEIFLLPDSKNNEANIIFHNVEKVNGEKISLDNFIKF